MLDRLGLRLRFFLFFALIAAGAVVIIGWACWYLGRKIDPNLMVDLILAGGVVVFAMVGLVFGVWSLFDEHVARPLLTMASEARVSVHAHGKHGLQDQTGRYLGNLAPVLREVIEALDLARQERDAIIQAAVADAKLQQTRLETVLQDLQEGVVICTLQHHIMLYNRLALEVFRGTGDLGLGRSFLSFVYPQPVRHALDRLRDRFATGRFKEHQEGLSTLVVCASACDQHQLLTRIALLLDTDRSQPVGYVVAFNDITDELAAGIQRDRLLLQVSSDLRQRISQISLAAEVLCRATHPDPCVEDLPALLHSALTAINGDLNRLDEAANDLLTAAWPMSDTFSPALLKMIRERSAERRDLRVDIDGDPVWLSCDGAAIVELLDQLLERVAAWAGVDRLQLFTHRSDSSAYLDIRWQGIPIPNALLSSWLDERLEEGLGPVSVGDILSRHNTDLWSQRLDEQWACLRLPLCLLENYYKRPLKSRVPTPERPEFYDFELSKRSASATLHDTPLRELSLVVFDLETTGLEPSQGDEIVSIAGVRIVNGRLLRGEFFDSFVNPRRKIPPAATRIHGIDDGMVGDADPISVVLSRFHEFVGDAVLVAHIAAFDMKFISLKQEQAQVRFEQPVLDTVLLAAHLFEGAEDLTLDTLAARFNISLPDEARHTALGDTIATAQVLLRLMNLLPAAGVHTLGEALAVSEKQVALRRAQSAY